MFFLLAGCLINPELYESRKAELTDGDGDGYAMQDECDDEAAEVHPGADEVCDGVDQDCDGSIDEDATDMAAYFEDADGDGHGSAAVKEWACETPNGFVDTDDDCDDASDVVLPGAEDEWYDGVDSNCDGADDYDADGDGDRMDEAGGTDCDDEDARVAGTAEEGWDDAGVDNDCDGSIEDQARVELSELGARIDGTDAGGSFGVSIVALPAGWADDEAVLLVSAPFFGGGDVYGWRSSDLVGSPSLASAIHHVTGSNDADYFGYGIGWGGDASTPLVIIGAGGALETRGEVEVWVRTDLSDTPTLTITGENTGAFLGSQVVSGYDHDGDGIADVLVTAQLDSRIATNAGAAFVFLSAAGLSGEIPVSAADIEFTTSYAGALLAVTSIGDVDGDGLDDLGFSQDIPYPNGPGGLLVTGARAEGTYDVSAVSSAQIHGGQFIFGRAWDPDGDGAKSLLAASGAVHSFALPLVGAVTPWDNATGSLGFVDTGRSVRWLRTDVGDLAGHSAFVAASPNYEGSRGMASVQRPDWTDGQTLDDGPFLGLGDAAGDEAGFGLDVLDLDSDGILDIAVGAPSADVGGVGSGSVYLVPGPR